MGYKYQPKRKDRAILTLLSLIRSPTKKKWARVYQKYKWMMILLLSSKKKKVKKRVRKMELRELGRTGLKLSCVGFGASPLGNVFGSVSEEQANASVRLAFQSGINFFDTSPYANPLSFSLSFIFLLLF